MIVSPIPRVIELLNLISKPYMGKECAERWSTMLVGATICFEAFILSNALIFGSNGIFPHKGLYYKKQISLKDLQVMFTYPGNLF